MAKVRFGIIGCGVIAPHHAEGILNDSRAELVAVCDIIEEKAQKFAQKFGAKKVFTDYNEMLKLEELDAICICVPSGRHGQCVIASAKAGKNILCEKPIDINKEVMTEMIKAVEENKVKMGCIFQNRTMSTLKKAKEVLDSGELGKMLIVEFQYRGYRSPAYYVSAGWRGTWALDGGGCLMNQGIHGVDTMCWLAGEVKSIYACADTMLRNIEVEDSVQALVEFKNGAKGVMMGTTLSNAVETSPEGDYLRIECEKGSIVYTAGKATMYLREGDGYYSTKLKTVELGDDKLNEASSASDNTAIDGDGHTILVKDLVSAILEDRQPYITGDSARKGVDVVLGIYESSRLQKRIEL